MLKRAVSSALGTGSLWWGGALRDRCGRGHRAISSHLWILGRGALLIFSQVSVGAHGAWWRSLRRHRDGSAGAGLHLAGRRGGGGRRRQLPSWRRCPGWHHRRWAMWRRHGRLEGVTGDGVVVRPAAGDGARVAAVRAATLRQREEARRASEPGHPARTTLREDGALQQRRVEAPGPVAVELRRRHDGLHVGSANALRWGRFSGLFRHRDGSAGAARHRDRERCLGRDVFRRRSGRPLAEIHVFIGVAALIVILVGRARGAWAGVTRVGCRAVLGLVVLLQCGIQLRHRPQDACVRSGALVGEGVLREAGARVIWVVRVALRCRQS